MWPPPVVARDFKSRKPAEPSFRAGASFIIPFLEIALPNPITLIVEILVGPTPHPRQAKDAVEALLNARGLPDVPSFPYRTW